MMNNRAKNKKYSKLILVECNRDMAVSGEEKHLFLALALPQRKQYVGQLI
jgi:hypothetical protein